jgi:hypothetical protein
MYRPGNVAGYMYPASLQHLHRIQQAVSAYVLLTMLRVQTEEHVAFVVHSVFEMDLETAAGASAAFVASVSTARYRWAMFSIWSGIQGHKQQSLMSCRWILGRCCRVATTFEKSSGNIACGDVASDYRSVYTYPYSCCTITTGFVENEMHISVFSEFVFVYFKHRLTKQLRYWKYSICM